MQVAARKGSAVTHSKCDADGVVYLPVREPCVITKWIAPQDSFVTKSGRLLRWKPASIESQAQSFAQSPQVSGSSVGVTNGTLLITSVAGKVTRLVSEGTVLQPTSPKGIPVARVFCTHGKQRAVTVDDTNAMNTKSCCFYCGKIFNGFDKECLFRRDASFVTIRHLVGVRMTEAFAREYVESEKRRLHKAKKLILVLDIDHTLLHTVMDNDSIRKQMQLFSKEQHDIHRCSIEEKRNNEPPRRGNYVVKTRPGLVDFLNHMSQLFEIHLYTMGNRNYALSMAEIMDPDKKHLGTALSLRERIVSYEDFGTDASRHAKNLADLFPYQQNFILCVDDRIDVWSKDPHVIMARSYEFWKDGVDINNSSGQSYNKEQNIGRDNDRFLGCLGRLLSQIHEQYYQAVSEDESKANVVHCVRKCRKSILAGHTICFAGSSSNVVTPQSSLVLLVEALGGKVVHSVEQCSVCIVLGKENDLVQKARESDKFCTSMQWVTDSALDFVCHHPKHFVNSTKPPQGWGVVCDNVLYSFCENNDDELSDRHSMGEASSDSLSSEESGDDDSSSYADGMSDDESDANARRGSLESLQAGQADLKRQRA